MSSRPEERRLMLAPRADDLTALDELMLERHEMLGTAPGPYTIARIALQGQHWTPRQAADLRTLIDAGEIK